MAFLFLAKAIAESLQKIDRRDRIEEFLLDLDRWELLFTSKADRDSYRDAIRSMWDVELEESIREPVNPDVLKHFQELASMLISEAKELLGLDRLNDTGLENSQRLWWLRNNKASPSTSSAATTLDINASRESCGPVPEILHPRPPALDVCSNTGTLKQEVKADVSITVKPMVILLMAGAIFTIVLIFLQCLFSSG
jgi:hypothetical protein